MAAKFLEHGVGADSFKLNDCPEISSRISPKRACARFPAKPVASALRLILKTDVISGRFLNGSIFKYRGKRPFPVER